MARLVLESKKRLFWEQILSVAMKKYPLVAKSRYPFLAR